MPRFYTQDTRTARPNRGHTASLSRANMELNPSPFSNQDVHLRNIGAGAIPRFASIMPTVGMLA